MHSEGRAAINPLYKGEVVWGRTKQRAARGRRQQSRRAANEWVVTKVEALRIVSDDLWDHAHASLRSRQKAFGFKHAVPRLTGARESKISAERIRAVRGVRRQHRAVPDRAEVGVPLLVQLERGPAVCSNTLTVPQERADLTVLRAVERDVLDPEVVEAALFVSLGHSRRRPAGAPLAAMS